MNLIKRSAAPAIALGLLSFFVWTIWAPGPTPGAPKVTRLLERPQAGEGSPRPSQEGRQKSERRAAKRGDSPISGGGKNKKVLFSIPKEHYVPVGRLKIPAIDLSVTYRDGVFDEVLIEGPGHWPGTPLPGAAGNSVLSGHRTTYTHPFGDLNLLERGDRVVTTAHENKPVLYKVTRVAIVEEERYVDYVLRQPKAKRLRRITMFACHPKGYRTHRIVVQAEAKPLPKPKPAPEVTSRNPQ
jgi:sortase A